LSGQLHAPSALPQGKTCRYLLDRRLDGHPEPVWTRCRRGKFPAPAGIRTPITRSSSPITLLVISYDYETCSITWNKEHETLKFTKCSKYVHLVVRRMKLVSIRRPCWNRAEGLEVGNGRICDYNWWDKKCI